VGLVGCEQPTLRQPSEQYLTSFHTDAHFLRQAKGRPHATQIFVGRSLFFRMGGI
jgi:hypothetical protein